MLIILLKFEIILSYRKPFFGILTSKCEQTCVVVTAPSSAVLDSVVDV